MNPGKGKQIDPLEQAIEVALSPRSFISYKAAWSFVDDVQDVALEIVRLDSRRFFGEHDLREMKRALLAKPSGAIGFYHSDCVAAQDDDGSVNWIIETKGRVWEGAQFRIWATNELNLVKPSILPYPCSSYGIGPPSVYEAQLQHH